MVAVAKAPREAEASLPPPLIPLAPPISDSARPIAYPPSVIFIAYPGVDVEITRESPFFTTPFSFVTSTGTRPENATGAAFSVLPPSKIPGRVEITPTASSPATAFLIVVIAKVDATVSPLSYDQSCVVVPKDTTVPAKSAPPDTSTG